LDLLSHEVNAQSGEYFITSRDFIANNIVAWATDKENPEEVPIFLKS
jgi:hypothetical protein